LVEKQQRLFAFFVTIENFSKDSLILSNLEFSFRANNYWSFICAMKALQLCTHRLVLTFIVLSSLCCKVVWPCTCNVGPLNELGIEDGHTPDETLKASSTLDANHGAGQARLNQGPTGSQGTAWCAKESNLDQYLEIDLIYTSRVTHVATQGMFDPPQVVNGSNITSWVKEYSLEYSSDGDTYSGYYFDKDLKIFDGNKDGSSISCCELPYPIVIRYLRFRPVSWQEKICLRVGVFGNVGIFVDRELGKVTITEGETRTLNCSKESYDGTYRRWFREDGTTVFSNRRLLTEDAQLQITDASIVDAGVYICENAPQIRQKFTVSIQAFLKVKMIVRVLNYEYSSELKNKTSPVYKSLERNFTAEIDKVYNNTPGYVRTEVLYFMQGSVKVGFRVIIVIVATDPKNATTISDRMAETAHRLLVEAKDGFVKQLQVDPNVVVKIPPPEPRSMEIFDKESDELSVKWRPPEGSDAFKVEKYVVQHREFKATVYTNASFPATKDKGTYTYRIQDLEPETTYMIRIGATNEYGSNFNEEEGHETLDAPFAKWIIAVTVLAIVLVLGISVGVIIYMRKRAEGNEERTQGTQTLY